MKITFGTDGWRGIIARDFTFDNVRLCAQGVASYLHQEGLADRGLVVGYDTRFASEEFAAEVAGVLAGNGVTSLLCSQAAPTPVVSYNVLHHRASGAAIITASHNPAGWSGFKYKPDYAGSASPEVIAALERAIAEAAPQGARFLPLPQAKQRSLVQEIDPAPPYLHQVASLVDTRALAGAGLRVVVDAMFGAGAGYLPRLIAGGATQVLELHSERNPAFPGMS
ncbi:MAG: phosphoglucomutase/phosphomannomutase family protein, partial [Dehalococcoidia bacterium]